MITEYYVIRRGHYRVADLYSSSKDGWYYYTYGINFRAYAAYISGIVINVVGFAGATGRDVPIAATRIYQMSFFTGFGVSSLIYYVLNRIFPVPGGIGSVDRFEEVDLSGYDYVPGVEYAAKLLIALPTDPCPGLPLFSPSLPPPIDTAVDVYRRPIACRRRPRFRERTIITTTRMGPVRVWGARVSIIIITILLLLPNSTTTNMGLGTTRILGIQPRERERERERRLTLEGRETGMRRERGLSLTTTGGSGGHHHHHHHPHPSATNVSSVTGPGVVGGDRDREREMHGIRRQREQQQQIHHGAPLPPPGPPLGPPPPPPSGAGPQGLAAVAAAADAISASVAAGSSSSASVSVSASVSGVPPSLPAVPPPPPPPSLGAPQPLTNGNAGRALSGSGSGSLAVVAARLGDSMEVIRAEYEVLAGELGSVRGQRDEFEAKGPGLRSARNSPDQSIFYKPGSAGTGTGSKDRERERGERLPDLREVKRMRVDSLEGASSSAPTSITVGGGTGAPGASVNGAPSGAKLPVLGSGSRAAMREREKMEEREKEWLKEKEKEKERGVGKEVSSKIVLCSSPPPSSSDPCTPSSTCSSPSTCTLLLILILLPPTTAAGETNNAWQPTATAATADTFKFVGFDTKVPACTWDGEYGTLDVGSVPDELKKEGSDWFALFNPRQGVSVNERREREREREKVVDVDVVHTFLHESVVCCVKFSSDGKFLATGCNRSAQIYDTKTGVKMCSLVDEGAPTGKGGDLYIRSVCFSPCGTWLATGAEDKMIRIWDIAKKRIRKILDGHQQEIYALEFSLDGRLLVSGSGDKTARVWDIDSALGAESGTNNNNDTAAKAIVLTISDNASDRMKDVDVDGDEIDDSADREGMDVDLEDKTKEGEEQIGTDAGITSIAVSPDGRYVAAGSLDSVIRLWDLRHPSSSSSSTSSAGERMLIERLKGHKDSVYSVSFTKDGRFLVSASLDQGVRVWDVGHLGIVPAPGVSEIVWGI
ncbi:hypothetical protein MD484_g6284, partial [Candolleomyces efflorescens]